MSDLDEMKRRLDALYRGYGVAYLQTDPLRYVHRYEDPLDREVVGLIATALAYGRVAQIFKGIEKVLEVMGPSPARYVARFDPRRDGRRLDGFVHRFTKGEDLACLLWFLKQITDRFGSLGGLCSTLYHKDDPHTGPLLSRFSEYLLSLDTTPFYGGEGMPVQGGVRYLLPSPASGSACKRLCLYLRWMVRRDTVDLGLWDFIPPSRLVIPLDTHIARIASRLGLTRLRSPGWSMAVEITENLKRLDPEDPLKYDFALCRLGILEECPKRRDEALCRACGLSGLCAETL